MEGKHISTRTSSAKTGPLKSVRATPLCSRPFFDVGVKASPSRRRVLGTFASCLFFPIALSKEACDAHVETLDHRRDREVEVHGRKPLARTDRRSPGQARISS